jgi:hypothetical protein
MSSLNLPPYTLLQTTGSSSLVGAGNIFLKSRVDANLAERRGLVILKGDARCEKCRNGNGPYASCVTGVFTNQPEIAGYAVNNGAKMFSGCCANCA